MARPSRNLSVGPESSARAGFGLRRGWRLVWLAVVLASGCRTSYPEASFAGPFDAVRVSRICQEAFQVGREATFGARCDLQFGAYHPTRPDWEVVRYLERLTWRIPWVARAANRDPAAPRSASKAAYDMVAYDAMMLRDRYRPASFQPSSNAKIERLLGLINELSAFYEVRKP